MYSNFFDYCASNSIYLFHYLMSCIYLSFFLRLLPSPCFHITIIFRFDIACRLNPPTLPYLTLLPVSNSWSRSWCTKTQAFCSAFSLCSSWRQCDQKIVLHHHTSSCPSAWWFICWSKACTSIRRRLCYIHKCAHTHPCTSRWSR